MPNPIDVKIGANIRMRRTLLGLSQEALGKALSKPITFQQIQKYERGTNRVSGSTIYEICRVLKCDVSDLFKEVGEANTAPESTRAEMEVMRLYRKLPSNMQTSVRGFMADIINHDPTRKWAEAGEPL